MDRPDEALADALGGEEPRIAPRPRNGWIAGSSSVIVGIGGWARRARLPNRSIGQRVPGWAERALVCLPSWTSVYGPAPMSVGDPERSTADQIAGHALSPRERLRGGAETRSGDAVTLTAAANPRIPPSYMAHHLTPSYSSESDAKRE